MKFSNKLLATLFPFGEEQNPQKSQYYIITIILLHTSHYGILWAIFTLAVRLE